MPRTCNIVDFARGTLLIDVAGRKYESEVVIGFTKDGICELYDIINLVQAEFEYKKETVSESFDSSESLRSDTTSNDSIPTETESVNKNLTETDTRYSLSTDRTYAPTFYSQMGKTVDEMKQAKIGAEKAGYKKDLYHGTAGAEFYVFRQGAEGIHLGAFAQATEGADDKTIKKRCRLHYNNFCVNIKKPPLCKGRWREERVTEGLL